MKYYNKSKHFKYIYNNISIILFLLYGIYIDTSLSIIKYPIFAVKLISLMIIFQNLFVLFIINSLILPEKRKLVINN